MVQISFCQYYLKYIRFLQQHILLFHAPSTLSTFSTLSTLSTFSTPEEIVQRKF